MTKKLISIITLIALLAISTPAFAAWQQDMQAAVNAGNTAKIDQIAAANTGAQGEIALFLLQQAQAKLASNPELAAKIFAAAGPFVNQVGGDNAQKAANVLTAMVASAKDSSFQQKNCVGALTILGAALSMSSLPNISAVAPNLHSITLAAANDSLESKPKCDTEELASLAEGTQRPSITIPGTPNPCVGDNCNCIGDNCPSGD
jgi:hypothetical protein